MNKLRLFAIVIIIALCLTATLAACDNAVYPPIEDVDEVFEAVGDITSYDCDIYFAYSFTAEEELINLNESYCLKYTSIGDVPMRYVYSIQDDSSFFYMIDTDVFRYKNNEYIDPAADEDETAEEEEAVETAAKISFYGYMLKLEPLLGLDQLTYEASYGVANQSTFTAVIEGSFLVALATEYSDIIDTIDEATVTIQASNKTMQPASILLALTGTITKEESEEAAAVRLQIKIVFKNYNKTIALDYPQEVQAYLDENYPAEE